MSKNINKIFIICIEGMKCWTEINFIQPIISQLPDFYLVTLDSCKKTDIKIPEKLCNPLIERFKDIELIELEEGAFLTINFIISSDGDLKEEHFEALSNTYKILDEHIVSYFQDKKSININVQEHIYDKGYSFEYFLWLLIPTANRDIVRTTDDKKIIEKQMINDILIFYEIDDIFELKKATTKI